MAAARFWLVSRNQIFLRISWRASQINSWCGGGADGGRTTIDIQLWLFTKVPSGLDPDPKPTNLRPEEGERKILSHWLLSGLWSEGTSPRFRGYSNEVMATSRILSGFKDNFMSPWLLNFFRAYSALSNLGGKIPRLYDYTKGPKMCFVIGTCL